MRRLQPQLGEAVQRILREHGLSHRGAAIRTGIDRQTIANMGEGLPPGLEIVEQFARSFGEEISAWRVLAGYEPITDRVAETRARYAPLSGHTVFWTEFGHWIEACRAAGLPLPEMPRFAGGTADLTPEQARETLEILKRAYREEEEKERRREGGP